MQLKIILCYEKLQQNEQTSEKCRWSKAAYKIITLKLAIYIHLKHICLLWKIKSKQINQTKNVVSQGNTLPSLHKPAQSQQRNTRTGHKIHTKPATKTPEQV